MKYIFIIAFTLGFALLMLNQSCNTDKTNNNSELLDSAKKAFIEFDQLSNTQKQENENILNESIRLLKDVIKSEPTNPDANYYLGYALDKKYNNYVDVLNFELINLANTEAVSSYFQNSIIDTNFTPDYKLSQYSYITNIWGRLALNYFIKGMPDSALFAFNEGKKRGGYTEANMEYAVNLLNSLAPNSILIVNTDLEAYTLWYMQFIENIRTDVSVINYSWLVYQWYAKWITFPSNMTNPLQSYLDDNTIQAAYSKAIITVTDTVITIKNQKSILYPKCNQNITTILKGVARNEEGILFPISDRITLAVIMANFWQKPIYFSINTAKFLPYSLGLSKYLKLEGLAARVYPEPIPLAQSVNGNKCLELLTNLFRFEKFRDNSAFKDRDLGFIATNYRFMYLQTLYYYSDYYFNDSVLKRITTQFEECFPKYYYPRTNEETALFNKINSNISKDTTRQ